MSVIETTDLTKHYGSLVAVDGVSLHVEAGQVYGFLGPNGSGKTTTIGMILGIITPTSGHVRLFGGDSPKELHEARGRIGATLESPNFYPYMSGYDNLRVVANVKGCARAEIDRVLEVVGLATRARDRFKTYSLGMKQRLALASAMLGSPEIIILDEPANGLDPEGMHEIRQVILGLAAEGKTIFLSSHLLSEVERTCTHAAVISRGRVVAEGTVRSLMAGSSRVELRADDLQALRAVVSTHPGVSGTTIEGDVVLVDVSTTDAAALNRYLAERGVFVSHLATRGRSLEDAFLSLTTADADAARGAA